MRSLIDTLGQHLGSKPTGEGLVLAGIIKTVLHCFLLDGTMSQFFTQSGKHVSKNNDTFFSKSPMAVTSTALE